MSGLHWNIVSSEKVRAFRQRFEGIDLELREERRRLYPTPEARFRECLELYELALLLDIQRQLNRNGGVHDAALMERVNAEREARSPLPTSLAERWSELERRRSV